MFTKDRFRVVNFRSFPIIALALVIAVFLALLTCNLPVLGFILSGLYALGLGAAAVLTRKRRRHVPLTWGLALVLSVAAFVGFYLSADVGNDLDYTAEHDVCGTVVSFAVRDGDGIVLLKNAKVDGNSVKGNIEVTVGGAIGTGLELTKPNDTLEFRAKLYQTRWVDGFRVNATAYRNRVLLRAYPNGEGCTLSFGTMNPMQKLRMQWRATLYEQLGKNYGDLAYGMLVGDKQGLSDVVRDYINAAGIGHILAVSGLHIGFITALLLFITKRTPPWVRVLVVSVSLIAYVVIAGYSASILRAAIMCEVGTLTLLNGQRKDSLSSLGLAVAVILTATPISMFDIGFIMTVSAVFGILCLAKIITRGLQKIRIPRRIASAVAVSTSAQLGITPALLYYFHTMQPYAILTNVLLMPVITVTFVLLLACSMVALLIPPIAVILKLPGILLGFLDLCAYGISLLPFASVIVYGSGLVFLLYLFYFIGSPFLMLPRGKRWVALGAAAAALVCAFVPIHAFRDRDSVIPIFAYRDVTSIVSIADDVYIVGDCNNAAAVESALSAAYVRKVKGVYLTGLTETNAEAVSALCRAFPIEAVYFPMEERMQGVGILARDGVPMYMFDDTWQLPFGAVFADSAFVGYTLREREKEILFLGYKTRYTALPESLYSSIGVVRCYMFLDTHPDFLYITNMRNTEAEKTPRFQLVAQGVSGVVFDYKNGEVYRRR